jgi:hypothetical protein
VVQLWQSEQFGTVGTVDSIGTVGTLNRLTLSGQKAMWELSVPLKLSLQWDCLDSARRTVGLVVVVGAVGAHGYAGEVLLEQWGLWAQLGRSGSLYCRKVLAQLGLLGLSVQLAL